MLQDQTPPQMLLLAFTVPFSIGMIPAACSLLRTDIFTTHNNTLQGADHLAEKLGCQVFMPDFFRGDSWPVENMPPKEGRPYLNAWVQERGSWDKVQPDLLATVKYLKDEGKTSLVVCTCECDRLLAN
jgi:dienelactone hydrolase